jgi:RimJ/RimL family protein N-acetyltransferase
MRRILTDDEGAPAITYLEGIRDGRPWAHQIEVAGPGAALTMIRLMCGWQISAPEPLCHELIDHGAQLVRHAHVMSHDLMGLAPSPSPPAGIRHVPCDRSPEEVVTAWLAAYPPDHPDHTTRNADEVVRDELIPLFAGTLIGPLLPCARLAVDERDEIVAGVVVNDWDGKPWIANVFRDPAHGRKGLGTGLLLSVMDRAASGGLPSLSLAVSDANPARRLYERLGFRLVETSMTVSL